MNNKILHKIEPHSRTLYYGDCLEIMRNFKPASVDVIYLDPPFNSKVEYNITYTKLKEHTSQYKAFSDTWSWDVEAEKMYHYITTMRQHPAQSVIKSLYGFLGKTSMMAYLVYMAARISEMHRLLNDEGVIYLHCDQSAVHYLRMLMDGIFGADRFLNEIIWCYDGPQCPSKKKYRKKHDNILRYSKTANFHFVENEINPMQEVSKEDLKKYQKHTDGRYYYTTPKGNYSDESIKELEKEDRIEYSKAGVANVRHFLVTKNGRVYRKKQMLDTWYDIPCTAVGSKYEKMDYPTQKPLKLLERILKASCKKDAVVLDPFCGSGTTIEAAERLSFKRWVGIDISLYAVNLVKKRLKDANLNIDGIPTDMASARQLAKDSPSQFETWAVNLIPGFLPNKKKVGDKGSDGHGILFNKIDGVGNGNLVLAQVKSGKFKLGDLRDFCYVIKRDNAVAGVFITLDKVQLFHTKTNKPSEARREQVNMKKFSEGKGSVVEYDTLQFFSIEEYFENKEKVNVNLPSLKNPYSNKMIQGGWFGDTSTKLFGKNKKVRLTMPDELSRNEDDEKDDSTISLFNRK